MHSIRAAAADAELVVLPEGTIPAYVLGNEPVDEHAVEAALAQAQAIARETHTVIVLGSVRMSEQRTYNAAVAIDTDGSIAGCADKQFLWHFDSQWFTPGTGIEPIRTAVGVLGVLVCADGRVPTIARTLVERGAQILVMPTAWVTSGRDPNALENIQADLLARIRAKENAVPFVAANKCGVERACVAYCGKSQIIEAAGTTVSVASQDRPETIVGEVGLCGAAVHVDAPDERAPAHGWIGGRVSIAARAVAAGHAAAGRTALDWRRSAADRRGTPSGRGRHRCSAARRAAVAGRAGPANGGPTQAPTGTGKR